MSIYAISDLHLCYSEPNKSMNMFGNAWCDYLNKIDKNWKSIIKENDTVIIPGDITWAMTLTDAYQDFKYLDELPGQKIILKGNHDYYFSTMTKLNDFFKTNNFNTIKLLNNNSYLVEGINICGTRLWGNTVSETADDRKVFKRELERLKLSLNSITDKSKPIIVATHFPPFRQEVERIFNEYNVVLCIYGHLHGEGHNMVKEGNIKGIEYMCVSGDYIDFMPKIIQLDV